MLRFFRSATKNVARRPFVGAAVISLLGILVLGPTLRKAHSESNSSADVVNRAAQQDTNEPEHGQPLILQDEQDVAQKSAGCQSCHTHSDSASMHATGTVRLGCTDCHGGDAGVQVAAGTAMNSPEYQSAKQKAHPQPKYAKADDSANPVRAYTRWLKEDIRWIRFVNPGDLRVAQQTCGTSGCHTAEVRKVRTSMMAHGALLWGAALYN
ncbi:MAG: hypothetical protein JO187_07455, partial [Acidobacteria bacterium]|nr:hypothetical protein [Acidobacteriota bacterium]